MMVRLPSCWKTDASPPKDRQLYWSFRSPLQYPLMTHSISYQDAGVSIDEADRAVGAIRKMARATFTKGVLTDIGAFGGCFALPKMRQPVLVSSVDGVGTKLKVAFAANRHHTIGEDLVNHCVNDIAVQGAKPLFFLDYLATGKLQADIAAQVISGIARGCAANGCALIGGETAEMPGMYLDGEYDIAGTIVGAVEKSAILTGAKVVAGDTLLALPSNGLHTNGYSLARKLLFEVAGLRLDALLHETGTLLVDELLKVHRSYLKAITTLVKSKSIAAAAHITGGGITDNLPRVLPKGLAASIDTKSWPVPPLFQMLRAIGSVPEDDWRRTFNLGVGMILVVPAAKADAATRTLRRSGEQPWIIGEVIPQHRGAKGKIRVEYR
jgi:phosphoribosylformylglycinamidine cyclo-ligase